MYKAKPFSTMFRTRPVENFPIKPVGRIELVNSPAWQKSARKESNVANRLLISMTGAPFSEKKRSVILNSVSSHGHSHRGWHEQIAAPIITVAGNKLECLAAEFVNEVTSHNWSG